MLIAVAADNTIPFHIGSFTSYINSYSKIIKCVDAEISPRFKSASLECEETINLVSEMFEEDIAKSDMVFVFTSIPFENNFFFIGNENLCVVSLYGWNLLTTLPMSNGIAFIICEFIVKYKMQIGTNHDTNRGCINDFLWDKTGIDLCMRAAFICEECKNISKANTWLKSQEFSDLSAILNSISDASRNGRDVLTESVKKPPQSEDADFDVFLCHNSKDESSVRSLNKKLKNSGLKTWFDEEQLLPGDLWQEKLEETISKIRACIVLVGTSGLGPWQLAEQRAFIGEFIDRRCRVIPVIIGNPGKIPELPIFLRQLMWVDLRVKPTVSLRNLVEVLK